MRINFVAKDLKFDAEDAALFANAYVTKIKGSSNAYVRIPSKERHDKLAHRVLLGVTAKDEIVDHINGDTLDNRRSNLRVVTKAMNGANRVRHSVKNTSGFRGVSYNKNRKKWQSRVMMNYKTIKLGFYVDPMFAAAVAATYRAIYMPGARK